MSVTAILVDGAFYRARFAKSGEHSPQEAADALVRYCSRHLHERSLSHTLYRIFYYDCPPSRKKIFHPLQNRTYDLSKHRNISGCVTSWMPSARSGRSRFGLAIWMK